MICPECDGTGYSGPGTKNQDLPLMMRPMGIYVCPTCKGHKTIGLTDEEKTKLMNDLQKCRGNKTSGTVETHVMDIAMKALEDKT